MKLLKNVSKLAPRLFSSSTKNPTTKEPHSEPPKEEVHVSLKGRNIIAPSNLSPDEIKSLIWTAHELKFFSNDDFFKIENLQRKLVTLVLSKSCIFIESAVESAARFIGLPINIIVNNCWENYAYPQDLGQILSKKSNLILFRSSIQGKVEKLAEKTTIPVVNLLSCRYSILRALSDLLTYQERFKYLENLSLRWIGVPSTLINTYMCITPRMGLDLKYYCACPTGDRLSPVLLDFARSYPSFDPSQFELKVHESQTINDLFDRADIIYTNEHKCSKMMLNSSKITSAHKEYVIAHEMPRGAKDIEDDLFYSNKNITWDCLENLKWMSAAIMLRCLMDHSHATPCPNFAKTPKKNQKDCKELQ